MDYIENERASIDFVPDWLLEPPPPSPFLEKKELVTKIPFPVKLLYSYHTAKQGRKLDEFKGRVKHELIESSDKGVLRNKLIQAKLKEH